MTSPAHDIHLAPGHWIAIATVAVVVLGGVISVALSEQNARLENVGTRLKAIAGAQTRMSDTQEQIAEGLARMEGELGTTRERLAGFEDRVDDRFDNIDNTLDRLIQLNLDATTQPATAGCPPPADPISTSAGKPRLGADHQRRPPP